MCLAVFLLTAPVPGFAIFGSRVTLLQEGAFTAERKAENFNGFVIISADSLWFSQNLSSANSTVLSG